MITLCGTTQMNRHPLEPYSDIVCEFLDTFSSELRKDAEAKSYADVMTFAFFARKGSIGRKKAEYMERISGRRRLGRGIIFHIAPSNVPVNCMYTYAFGLLAGNGNIVRIPSKSFPQVEIMLRILGAVLEREEYSLIREMTSFVRYEREETEWTEKFSSMCDIRVIWGGDRTISSIRRFSLPPKSTEITFADRYSFGIVDAKTIIDMSDKDVSRLAVAFYNDTYLMDQNACSSPHMICFRRGNLSIDKIAEAKERFWRSVACEASRYDLSDIKVSDKYTDLCEGIMAGEEYSEVKSYGNELYVCRLTDIPEDAVDKCRGRYGLFFEYEFDELKELEFMSDGKVQTCAVCGIDEEEVRNYLVENGITGVDRVVAFGRTLDIDTVWDGYDIISSMSRIIC